MEESKKTELIGKVVSDKSNKTITVAIETYKQHPIYKKRVKYTKKYSVHDEENQAHIGDTVKIIASRPLSKTKRFVLGSIVEKAVIL